ncbi:MAG TPA: hypothetical protein VHI13_11720 [Candidatus Kapabacteria bacterium]|nr:hypothetical protein [Candidatus Kapabacteria bacterium]
MFNLETAGEFALGGLGGIIYTVLPTALNLSGPGAMATALLACYALGFWLESKALLAGGFFVAVVHMIYKYGSNLTMKAWGRPVWSLDPSVPSVPGGMGDYVNYNPYGPNYGMHDAVQLPNGYSALALPPADVPAPAQAMNDYAMPHEQLMDDDGFYSKSRYEQNGSYDASSIFE